MLKLSFESGVVPQQLKIARVVPIYKAGDRFPKNNYRPISILPTFSKIMEKIVAGRLTTFFNDNNLLSQWQFGFRARHSTIHPMVHLLNHVTDAFNNKQSSIAIFCDLRKAFDTCDHNILLDKLAKYGVLGSELQWFKSYLSNRKQFVTINNHKSNLLEVMLGVPQGSFLGPLLFIIYINDLPNIKLFLSLLFADDTILLLSDSNIHSLYRRVNTEFRKVCEFFRMNKLALHQGKTNYILFTKQKLQNLPNLFCNNNNEDEKDPLLLHVISNINVHSDTSAAKFLGVYFDPQLNFKFHISTLFAKNGQEWP